MKVLPVPGYDTGSFLLAFTRFTSNYGVPSLVVSDLGSQLVKAGKMVNKEEKPAWDWRKIERETLKSGTKWVFVAAGCHWRNGLVERQIQSLKRSLDHVLSANACLNFAELDTLFSSVANLVNQRPLAVRSMGEDDFRSITPNDLLLGRTRQVLRSSSQYGDSDN